MDENVCGLTNVGMAWEVNRSLDAFKVEAHEKFYGCLTNPLKTVDGTVGTRHRKELHTLLDEWIDNRLKSGDQ